MPIASSGDTVLSILLLVILVLGYVVLWAIGHFFFRARDLQTAATTRAESLGAAVFAPTHLVIILMIALLVLGPKRLPEAGRSVGEAIRGFKDSVSGPDRDSDPPTLDRRDEGQLSGGDGDLPVVECSHEV
jgi:sec-independent protein translocase protein TatA